MICWMFKNTRSFEAKVVLNISQILKRPHLKYCSRASALLLRQVNGNIKLTLKGIQRRVTKMIKRLKDYIYKKELEKLTALIDIRIRGVLIENFEMTNEIWD